MTQYRLQVRLSRVIGGRRRVMKRYVWLTELTGCNLRKPSSESTVYRWSYGDVARRFRASRRCAVRFLLTAAAVRGSSSQTALTVKRRSRDS